MSSSAMSSPTVRRQRMPSYPLRTDGSPRRTNPGDAPPADSAAPATDQGAQVRALEVEVEQLRTAMASRAVIEQAKGVLMVLTGCGEQTAFDLLTHMSSHTHRKVREVAQEITGSAAGRCRLPDDVRAILRDACPPAHPMH